MKLERCRMRSRDRDGRWGPCPNSVPPGMTVCDDHATLLAAALVMVSDLGGAFDDARAKAQRFSAARRGAYRPALCDEEESPVPFRSATTDAERALRDGLAQACRWISQARTHLPPPTTLPDMARWLLPQLAWMRTLNTGPDMVTHLQRLIADAARAVDRPADLTCLGECNHVLEDATPCRTMLYATEGATTVTCEACTTTYRVAELRAALLNRAEDQLFTTTDMAGAVAGFGIDITPHRIEVWKNRGRLVPHATNRQGRPVYRVGDVLDLLAGLKARQTNAQRRRRKTTAKTSV